MRQLQVTYYTCKGSAQTQKREGKWRKNSDQNCSKFDETQRSKSSQTPSIKTSSKVHTPRYITIKLLKNRGKGKILKVVRGKKKKSHVYIQEWNKDSRFLKRNKASKKTVECYNISKILEEKTSNLEYYTHQNYLSKVKAYKKSFQT